MSISKAKLYLHGMINNLENCIEEGSYVTYKDIINQIGRASCRERV